MRKMKRLFLAVLVGLFCAFGVVGFSSCDLISQMFEEPDWEGESESVEEMFMEFERLGDGYTLTGVYNADNETEIEIPATYEGLPVVKIGRGVFENWKNLKSVIIPDSVAVIGEDAFRGSGLESIVIPNSVRYVEFSAFCSCLNATSLTIGENVCYIEPSAFNECDNLTEIHYNAIDFAGKTLGWDFRKDTEVTIGAKVEHIPQNLFHGCKGIVSVTFAEESVCESIGKGAFQWCDNLRSVRLGKNLKSIGDNAFYGCENLEELEVFSTLWSNFSEGEFYLNQIENAFHGCDKLQCNEYEGGLYYGNKDNPYLILVATADNAVTEIDVHSRTEYIHREAFWLCQELKTVRLPDSLVAVGDCAFPFESSTSFYYKGTNEQWKKVVFVGWNIWEYADKLYIDGKAVKKEIAPEPVYTEYENGYYLGEGDNPYYYFVSVVEDKDEDTEDASFVLHEDTKVICEEAFWQYPLESILLPDGLISIENGAFSETKLTSIVIPNSVTYIGDYPFLSTPLTSIVLPEGFSRISDYMFSGTAIESFIIPDGVVTIGVNIFNKYIGDVPLQYVVVPESVTKIDAYALGRAREVFYKGSESDWFYVNVNYFDDMFSSGSNNLLLDRVYYYSETKPVRGENISDNDYRYWHYDENGEIEIW